ncbi:MAG: phosphatase PAP2 family protein [Paludibacteraceae bacterium]|nr:phosphatase PAP2 family protein [Paludibacteraceae bacterium]
MKYIKQNMLFMGLCLALIAALGTALVLVPKAELHLWLNQYHRPFLDHFFRYYTKVGEWFPYVIALLLLLYKAGWSVFFAVDAALCSLVGQIVKHLVDAPRPITYFAQHFPDIQLPLVEGVRMNRFLSFPSGHTISFFAMFFALSIILVDYLETKKSRYPRGVIFSAQELTQLLCFCFAAFGAYSRIYLSQHFAADICGGVTISFAITLILCGFLPLLSSKKWWNWNFFAKK